MLTSTPCPDFHAYRQMTSGRLAADQTESLIRHLETCDVCAGKIQSLPASDTLIEWIRQAKSSSASPEDKQLTTLMQRLIQLGKPAASSPSVSIGPLTFSCTGCGKAMRVKEQAAGKKVKCPHCGQVVQAPLVGSTGVSPVDSQTSSPGGMETVDVPSVPSAVSKVGTPSRAPTSVKWDQSDKEHELCAFLAPAQSADELGRLGSYRVLNVLGAGGMGVVFRAEDAQLQRLVAIKAMLPALAANESARQRFLREARLAASLKHDHIVTIHQVGEDRGAPYLAMEFLEGESLEDRLKREGKLPLAEVLRIGREIAEGLQAAHEHGLIHRDIKPANVWLEGKRGRAKILDFGLARSSGDDVHLTQSGAIVGTPAYMPPEQARGEAVDGRCDLYSLGCVLYRLSTGELPFKGENTMSLLLALAVEQPKSPRDLNPDVPPPLADLIMRLLAKDAAQRPATAGEVAQALQDIAEEAPSQRETKPRSSAKRTPRRQRRWLWAAAVALLLLGAGGAYFVYQIVIVRDKDGNEVARLKVPPRGSIHIEPEASANQGKTPKATIVPPPEEKAKLPAPWAASPLDALDPAQIPVSERFDWQPKELVAVIGEHRQRHWRDIDNLTLSVDGATVATTGQDGRVRFWDTATLEARGASEYSATQLGGFVVYVPAGPHKGLVWWAVAHPYNRVRLLDPKTVRLDPCGTDWILPLEGPTELNVNGIAASSDGRYLASTNWSSVQIWDVGGAKPKRMPSLKMEGDSPIAFAPGSNVLACCPSAKELRLVDLAKPDRPEIARLNLEQQAGSLAFAKNGRRLAVGGAQGLVTMWDLADKEWKRRATFNVSALAAVHHLDFSHNGKQLAVSGHYSFAAEVWDVEQPKPKLRLRLGWGDLRATFTSDDRYLIATSSQMVRRWELGDQEAVERPKIALERAFPAANRYDDPMVVSPDGRRLATYTFDNELHLWELGGSRPRQHQTSPKNPMPGWPPWWGAFSPDASLLAIYQSEPPFTRLWDVASPQPQLSVRYKATVNQTVTAWSLDGQRVYAFALGQQAAQLYVLDGSGPVLRRIASADTSVDTRGGGPMRNRLSGGTLAFKLRGEFDGFEVWDVSGEKPRRRALLHKGDHCVDLSVSPDGKRLACACTNDNNDGITLWDLSGAELRKLEKLDVDRPTSVCFMPDGQRLVWSDRSGRLVLWDPALQGAEREWKLPGVVAQIFASRDGRHILTYNGNGTIYVLRLAQRESKVAPTDKPLSPPVQIPEPPPLAEWLKGRKVLTVSQDGKGQFKTIQAALDALKPGQVVKVLDRGPYRERLSLNPVPEDTGLVSENQTVLELSEWAKDDNQTHFGHYFRFSQGFRMHGFAMIFPTLPPKFGFGLYVTNPSDFLLENCLLQDPEPTELVMSVFMNWGEDTDGASVWVRDCMFRGRLTFASKEQSARAVVERNYLVGPGMSQALFVRGDFTKVVIRHNVLGPRVQHNTIGFSEMKEVDALEVRNNTLIGPYPLSFASSAPGKNVTIRNNLHSETGLLSLVGGLEKELPTLTENWRVDHNSYPRQLRHGELQLLKQNIFPQAGSDVLAEPKFLSLDPAHPDFLRIAADGPLAKAGAGGAWPSYIGALPPGPAPKDGDWFTRLRQKWGNNKPAVGK